MVYVPKFIGEWAIPSVIITTFLWGCLSRDEIQKNREEVFRHSLSKTNISLERVVSYENEGDIIGMDGVSDYSVILNNNDATYSRVFIRGYERD